MKHGQCERCVELAAEVDALNHHLDAAYEASGLSKSSSKPLAAHIIELLSRPAQQQPDPAARFVMWALMEGSWQGCDIDGGAAQDKAVELGLIIEDQYDPKRHGENSYCKPGDQWFIPSEALLSALTPAEGKTPPGHETCSACGRLFKWGETCTRGGCPCGGDV